SGNFSLITPGNNTLQMAIPNPIQSVPKNRKNTMEMDRKLIPTINVNSPIVNAHSFENLLASLGVSGDIIAKAIKGKLVKKATLQLEKPTSSLIVPIKGPTDVIAGRKLK